MVDKCPGCTCTVVIVLLNSRALMWLNDYLRAILWNLC